MNNVEDFNRSAASGQSDAKLYVMLNTGVGGAYIDKENYRPVCITVMASSDI